MNTYLTQIQNVDTDDNALLVKVVNSYDRDRLEQRVKGRRHFVNGSFTDSAPGTFNPLIPQPANFKIPTVADVVRVASGNVNDTFAGSGLQIVAITGLDADLTEVFDVVAMNGTTPVNSNRVFYRVNSLVAVQVGSNGFNQGLIFCGAFSGGFSTTTGFANGNYSVMRVNDNYGGSPLFTVPKGYKVYPLGLQVNCTHNTTLAIRMYYRATIGSGPFLFINVANANATQVLQTFIGSKATRGEYLFYGDVIAGTANLPGSVIYAFEAVPDGLDSSQI